MRQGEKSIEELKEIEFLNQLLRHDLLNKIQIAIGYLGIEGDDKKEKAMHILHAASKDINNIRSIISSMGEPPEPINIDEILEEVMRKYTPHAQENDIDIEYVPTGYTVMGNRLLDNVFSNLIEDSIKHSKSNIIDIYGWEDDGFYVISIEDNGIGIDDDLKEKIFNIGHRGKDSSGSGFGLYAVRRIVNGLGGKVTVDDSRKYPSGTVFDVYLMKPNSSK
ncbi:MAG: HAMP domain-containing histidine kinase [Candidatus Aenigmarchaeota archaeon]|nr:HAMP domain-containing histidine kinase [Candidatus Aenigmarchaeota archaeon]